MAGAGTLWRLRPRADQRNDPRWGGVQHQADVLVRCATAERARDLASDALCPGVKARGGSSPWSEPDLTTCDETEFDPALSGEGFNGTPSAEEGVIEPRLGPNRSELSA
ncbi:hypothetical protein [Zavarzinia sp. CC-PAN008]|uniref:hypothetical protein n=1 Tax=Zavarzinia sp. CC-PAN008 TaxID=3243332 RepID=UPI003F747074